MISSVNVATEDQNDRANQVTETIQRTADAANQLLMKTDHLSELVARFRV